MTSSRAGRRGAVRFVAAAISACALGGCVEPADDLQTASIDPSQTLALRPGVSPGGATLAIASIEGLPPDLATKFNSQFAAASASRSIVMGDPRSANYLVRGYLTAYAVADGTAIKVVWDVFDDQKRHARRVDDTITVKGSAGDPWSLADTDLMAKVAGRSADELAAFLSNTPEAIAAADHPPAALASAPANPPAATVGATLPGLLSYC